jgi:hypothetical protein
LEKATFDIFQLLIANCHLLILARDFVVPKPLQIFINLARIRLMSLVCAQCSRVNPPEASYCYHDGAALAGRAGGPINAGSAPFPNQFVFPNGLACRNFDQLAMTCQQHWSAAVDLLKQGYLGSFFGGMGRVDLAMAAQEAAKFPDIDRGLDLLLTKLPTQALQPPKLQAEPTVINLGQFKIGTDRTTEIHLANLGMRLLYGTATSDCKWLTFGEAPGHSEKIFQFGSEAVLTVQVRGQHLRAGLKPLEGQVTIDSNGGMVTVTIKADIPITPYGSGPFAGATTPRQVAEKAKANPKDTASLFESGEVAKWYAANGWNYPVQGPIMPGLGAIQQFFEALGVAKAPQVEASPKTLGLQAAVGKTVDTVVEVTTSERKVVYGWATCDQYWVEIGKTKLAGRTAAIPIRLHIPSPCPPTLQATINVVGNGNQKLAVPLTVQVAGGKPGVQLKAPVDHDVLEIIDDAPMAVSAGPPPLPGYDSPFAIDDTAPRPSPVTKPAPQLPLIVRLALHTMPLGLLAFVLLILLARDVFFASSAVRDTLGDGDIDPRPVVKLVFNEGRADANDDSMTFGVHRVFPEDPAKPSVRLNWYPNGGGNSVVAKIDDRASIFGVDGLWASDRTGLPMPAGKHGNGKTRTFHFTKEALHVTQTVTVEPGDPIQTGPDEYKRLLNMCLVRYKLHNKDNRPHTVGLRVLMDTCIGDNDGVPFLLPGVKEMVASSKEFRGIEVPDFVQVLERPNLNDPGLVLQLNLRVSKDLEMPSRFLLTRYPGKEGNKHHKWDVPSVPIKEDSCVALWWDEKVLNAGATREIGFAYGVNTLSIASSKLAVTVGGAMHKGGDLTVVALVSDANAKSVTLELPSNLELLEPKSLTQNVAAVRDGRPSAVTWRVRAIGVGANDVTVTTDTNVKQARRVRISLKSLFN